MSALGDFIQYGLLKSVRKLRASLLSPMYARRSAASPDTPARSTYGILLSPNWTDKTFRYCVFGTYGCDLSDYLSGFSEPFHFLDIGSNQGLYALVAAKNHNCKKIFAFEPVARTFKLLKKNVAINAMNDRIVPLNLAISQQAGTASISIDRGHSGTASMAGGATSQSAAVEQIKTIDVVGLDALMSDSVPIIVKVDVEGFEKTVITELSRSQHFGRMVSIFYEVDERWSDSADIRSVLEAGGFSRFQKFGRGHHYDVLAMR
jgi:FkbM family methyltransferase